MVDSQTYQWQANAALILLEKAIDNLVNINPSPSSKEGKLLERLGFAHKDFMKQKE